MTGVLKRALGRARSTTAFPAALETINFHSGLGDSAFMLYGLARALKPEVAVEIGSARGKSACYVGAALKQNDRGKLYAIDPHVRTDWNDLDSIDTLAEMRANIKTLHLESHVEIVREMSSDAAANWSHPIDMLFIDGDHSYEGVKRDWELFSPHVSSFGVVVFHDTIWDLRSDARYARKDMGVPAFVEELRSTGYPVITLDRDFGVSMVQPIPGGIALK
jgi:predicted O-methyltransferase YrrM